MYGRFMVGLPPFLRRRLTIADAEAAIRTGLAEREANFLRIARHGIFENPRSPYLPLLQMAGCAFEDLEASVRAEGLEPTLATLRSAGVYVTFEEYKGRQPIVRGVCRVGAGVGRQTSASFTGSSRSRARARDARAAASRAPGSAAGRG